MADIETPPPHLLKKFSTEARDESNKRNGAGYLKTFAKLCIEWANSKSSSSLSQIRSSEIQPPPELFADWLRQAFECSPHNHSPGMISGFMARKAAQWGADQELEACCEWFADDAVSEVVSVVAELRAARRPNPPSLKEQALKELRQLPIDPELGVRASALDTIRRALEALPND